MTPARALCPKCVANATVDRSIERNIAPSDRYEGTSTARLGAARLARLPPRVRVRRGADDSADDGADDGADNGAADPEAATTGGSVDRCDANHSDPKKAHRAAQ